MRLFRKRKQPKADANLLAYFQQRGWPSPYHTTQTPTLAPGSSIWPAQLFAAAGPTVAYQGLAEWQAERDALAKQHRKQLDALMGEPEITDVIRGWRTFALKKGLLLQGSFGTTWGASELEAECKGLLGDIRPASPGTAREHLAAGICGCGIYTHKRGPEYSYGLSGELCETWPVQIVAQCVIWGIVYEAELGYRSERCRIEQLWMLTPRPCGHEKVMAAVNGAVQWEHEGVAAEEQEFWAAQGVAEDVLAIILPQRERLPVGTPEAVAQVLRTTYQVPVHTIPVLEFLVALDKGEL